MKSHRVSVYEQGAHTWVVVLFDGEHELSRWIGEDLYSLMHSASASMLVGRRLREIIAADKMEEG